MFNKPILYHYPLSFSSQIARLALTEKGVSWKSRIVDIGLPHENFSPWYMRINSDGVVPTLSHNDIIITDSINIALYTNNNFPGPALVPSLDKERELMEQFVNLQQQFPETELTYVSLSGITRRIARWDLENRKSDLANHAKKNEDLEDLYRAKYDQVEHLIESIDNPKRKQDLNNRVHKILDLLEEASVRDEWLAGPDYSLADVVWTVFLARAEMLGFRELWQGGRHPNVGAYYAKVKARPSFKKAKIYTKTSRTVFLRGVVKAYRLTPIFAIALAAFGAYGAAWWFGFV